MNRVGGISANLRPPGRLGRWGAAGALAGAAVRAAAADAGPTVPPLPFTLALAAAAVVIGALLAWRLMRSRQQLAEALREARARSDCLEPLLDVWLWQTDAEHRLVSTRPPHGAPTAAWTSAPTATPLWEHFAADDAAALRAQLDAAAPLDDIPIALAGGAAPRRGLLRGRAHRDATGRLAGYLGDRKSVV